MERNIELLFEIHEKNEEWFSAHLEELQRKYGSRFFAIKDQDVLAAENDMEKLLSVIEKKNIDPNQIFITSIPPEGVAAIL